MNSVASRRWNLEQGVTFGPWRFAQNRWGV